MFPANLELPHYTELSFFQEVDEKWRHHDQNENPTFLKYLSLYMVNCNFIQTNNSDFPLTLD
jgi:hypothetical protein